MKIKKAFIPIIILILLSVSFASLSLLYLIVPGPLGETKNILIYKGTSTKNIARNLHKEEIIRFPYFFNIITKFYGLAGKHLKSGEYALTERITPLQILEILSSGKSVIHKLTIVEGVTVHDIIEQLRSEELLTGEVEVDCTEGFLMPSTYFFSFGDSRQKILSQMKRLMSDTLDELMPQLSKDSPLKTRLDVLILASIVEKEAGNEDEKPIIAGAFINRLKKKMKLQADPTTIYALTLGKSHLNRLLTKQDLLINSPYNTYYRLGLPPTPIACPSKSSIKAVITPAKTDVLYFVTNGNRGHNFSKSLEEHNMHVRNYRKSIAKQ